MIIDGGWLIHSQLWAMKRIPNYGSLARALLSSVVNHAKSSEIHIVFETYSQGSLKSIERERRSNTDKEYVISGSDQKPSLTTDFLLKTRVSNMNWPSFLWENGKKKNIWSTLYIGEKKLCFSWWILCLHWWCCESCGKPRKFARNSWRSRHLSGIYHVLQSQGSVVVRGTTNMEELFLILGKVTQEDTLMFLLSTWN